MVFLATDSRKVLTFTEACHATLDDIIEANAVLDVKYEQEKIAIEKAKQEANKNNGSGKTTLR